MYIIHNTYNLAYRYPIKYLLYQDLGTVQKKKVINIKPLPNKKGTLLEIFVAHEHFLQFFC